MSVNWPTPKELQEARRQAIALSPKQREELIAKWELEQYQRQQTALERIALDQQIENCTSVLLHQDRI